MNFKEWLELTENYDYYGAFQRWYDFNRGSWKEVEAAAQKDPRIRYLLNTAMGHLDSFGGKMYPKIADSLEKQVSRQFPHHVKHSSSIVPMKYPTNQTDPGATKAPSSANGQSGFQLSPQTPQIRQGQSATNQATVPHINKTLTDHERRLKNLEAMLQRKHAMQAVRSGAETTTDMPAYA